MQMQMDSGEIARSYKLAANPHYQIEVLADLNCCSKDDIIMIIRAAGLEVAERRTKYSKHKLVKKAES